MVPSEEEATPVELLLSLTKKGVYGAARLFQPPAAPTPRPAPCTLQLRLVGSHPRRKWLYLVRHGESEWNRAQGALDLGAMYSQVDRFPRPRTTSHDLARPRTASHGLARPRLTSPDLGAMCSQVDHPLSRQGVEQASRLADKISALPPPAAGGGGRGPAGGCWPGCLP